MTGVKSLSIKVKMNALAIKGFGQQPV